MEGPFAGRASKTRGTIAIALCEAMLGWTSSEGAKAHVDLASRYVLVDRRQPLQHFEAPPQEVAADRNTERHLDQLDDEFVFAHRISACCCAPDRLGAPIK